MFRVSRGFFERLLPPLPPSTPWLCLLRPLSFCPVLSKLLCTPFSVLVFSRGLALAGSGALLGHHAQLSVARGPSAPPEPHSYKMGLIPLMDSSKVSQTLQKDQPPVGRQKSSPCTLVPDGHSPVGSTRHTGECQSELKDI